jgi:predicted dehydrogenase
MTAQEAESMCAVADEQGCLALLDHQLRFSPNLVRLRRLLRDGYIGKPMHVELALRVGGHLDPRRQHNWWSEEARGGGVLGALGSHMIDLLRWTLGDVHAVCGTQHTFIGDRPVADSVQRRTVTSDDHAAFWLVLGEHHVHASVTVSVVAHATDALRLEISGRNGMLRLDEDSRLWGSRRDPEMTATPQSLSAERLDADNPLTPEQRRRVPDSLFGQAFAVYAGHLVRGIAESDAGPWQEGPLRAAATFHDGLSVQRALDALRRSHQERRWVDLL